MKKTIVREQKDYSVLFGIIKGSLIALCISLLGVLIFAFILRFVPIADSVISPVNQVIKGVSIFLGTILGLRKVREMGLVSGILIGFLYSCFAFLTFSILSRDFAFDMSLLNDILFGAIIGGICGIIAVNLKKKSSK